MDVIVDIQCSPHTHERTERKWCFSRFIYRKWMCGALWPGGSQQRMEYVFNLTLLMKLWLRCRQCRCECWPPHIFFCEFALIWIVNTESLMCVCVCECYGGQWKTMHSLNYSSIRDISYSWSLCVYGRTNGAVYKSNQMNRVRCLAKAFIPLIFQALPFYINSFCKPKSCKPKSFLVSSSDPGHFDDQFFPLNSLHYRAVIYMHWRVNNNE